MQRERAGGSGQVVKGRRDVRRDVRDGGRIGGRSSHGVVQFRGGAATTPRENNDWAGGVAAPSALPRHEASPCTPGQRRPTAARPRCSDTRASTAVEQEYVEWRLCVLESICWRGSLLNEDSARGRGDWPCRHRPLEVQLLLLLLLLLLPAAVAMSAPPAQRPAPTPPPPSLFCHPLLRGSPLPAPAALDTQTTVQIACPVDSTGGWIRIDRCWSAARSLHLQDDCRAGPWRPLTKQGPAWPDQENAFNQENACTHQIRPALPPRDVRVRLHGRRTARWLARSPPQVTHPGAASLLIISTYLAPPMPPDWLLGTSQPDCQMV